MKLTEIVWPVYKLAQERPNVEECLVFYHKKSKAGDVILVIDDISVRGATLARRRLKLSADGVKLYPITKAVFYLGDFIKLAKPNQWFIDSTGKFFSYTKTKSVPLIFREILSVEKQVGSSLLEIEGIHGKHKCLYAPTDIQKYAGLLKLGPHTYVLYGLFPELHKDTTRKI